MKQEKDKQENIELKDRIKRLEIELDTTKK